VSDASQKFDVAIIGAGVNGAGIARDAALRGLSVIILDKNDMCSGTSAVSSRLIHGGLRYLEYGEIPLVYESLHERRSLCRIAAHLVKPLRISIPVFSGARRGKFLIRLGMLAYDLLSLGKFLPAHDMLNRAEIMTEEPGLSDVALVGAAQYSDAQVTFAERLVLENLLAARSAGAIIETYSEVREIRTHKGRVSSLIYVDRQGREHEINVRTVVNAAGPWVDEVLKAAPKRVKRFVGGTKGSHIVVGRFNGAPKNAFYVEAAADGRPIFIIPWNQQYLIGTTDIRYQDSLDHIRASRAEVDYLLAETNRIFSKAKLTSSDIHFAYAGVRPLPRREKGPESAITRRHIIKVNRNIAVGLVSIIGGKLTTYRNLAEQTVDKLSKILRRKLPESRTDETLLPGAWGVDKARDVLAASNLLSGLGAERLLSIYGGRVADIVALANADVASKKTLGDNSVHLFAEILFVIREEFPRQLTDIVFRRTMIGFDANQGRPYYEQIADIAADELHWPAAVRAAELQELREYADSLRVS
jgi:glycerol-3-phosphate dehydrogenase